MMGIREHLRNGPLGFGAAPSSNMFRSNPDPDAAAAAQTAWTAGTRFFDKAPLYAAGLSEIRLGKELSRDRRSEYVLSSKVGRLILDKLEQEGKTFGEKGRFFKHRRRKKVVYDYTRKAQCVAAFFARAARRFSTTNSPCSD